MITRKLPHALWLLLCCGSVQAAETDKTYAIVNNLYHGRITLRFQQDFACLPQPLLREWGFLPAIKDTALFDAAGCLLKSEIARWKIRYFFDPQAQLITLVVPDHLMTNMQNGIATSRWDEGIPALFTNYQLGYQRKSGRNYPYQTDKDSVDVLLDSGANLAGWRLRASQQYLDSSYGECGWLTSKTSLSRTVRPLRAQFTLGDGTTPSNLFDNFNYRGISLTSDERMLPDGLRPFSPWIRGIAKTNARVVLRQNGMVIYQTFVAPGPFTLRNVFPPAAEGDLDMTITESDGSETFRTMPYAAMPNLTHPKVMNFQLVAGHYRRWRGSDLEQPAFAQGVLTWGVTDWLSLFAGELSSSLFNSSGVGAGFSMGQAGAISVDRRYSVAAEPRRSEKDRGSVWRIRYAKAFLATGTSLSLQAQYYPRDQRYRHFEETIYQQKTWWWEWDDEGRYEGEFDPERQTSVTFYLNQNVGESSNLYATFRRDKLRQQYQHSTSLTMGFDHSWNDIDYNLDVSWERDSQLPANGEVTLSVSIPLDYFRTGRPKLNLARTFSHHSDRSQQLSVSGTALEDFSLSYSVGAEHHQTENDSINASLGYQYNAGELHVGAAQGGNFRRRDLDISGSLMAHPYGVTLGQPLGDTMALVEVENSPGIGINNQFGVTTDRRGFALVSNLTPFRVNRLTLDSYNLPDNVQLPETELDVVPTAGAVVLGRFGALRPR